MARHMRPLLRLMLMWSHGMTPSKFLTYALLFTSDTVSTKYFEFSFPGTPIWSRRSTRISFGSHHETNHSLYSVATNVLNLSDPFATSSLSLEASCQYSQLEQTHLSDIKRSDRLRTNLILRYIAETRAGAGVSESQKALTEKATWYVDNFATLVYEVSCMPLEWSQPNLYHIVLLFSIAWFCIIW